MYNTLSVCRQRILHVGSCCMNKMSRFSRGMTKFTSFKIRKTFLNYFIQSKGHAYVEPSSVIPHGDNSLLFTSAGMNQFKSIFLGAIGSNSPLSSLTTATNSQKCIRVGGKHNDLDDVGRDCYHHTFFEMLGNWSFGQYFKEESCRMSWELLTGHFGIPSDRLFVTYFGGDSSLGLESDEECRDVWLRVGVSPNRILPFGCKDNFWEMGNTGPCGPCTEIHYSHVGNGDEAVRLVNAGRPEVIELWNLVFIQYDRQIDGALKKLPKFHVDTGMGLERLSAVLQGSVSNYDTDLFLPLFAAIQKGSGCRPYSGRFELNDHDRVDTAYRIVADHARMCAVSTADGLIPDEYGAGHCLRKVIRRAVIASRTALKSPPGLVANLLPHVAVSLGDAFPEIQTNLSKAVEVVCEEEERFLKLLGKGLSLFQEMCIDRKCQNNSFSAENVWELFFVHGIPEDVILELCESRGLTPDVDRFRMKFSQEKAKSAEAYQLHLAKSQENAFSFGSDAADILRANRNVETDDKAKYESTFVNDELVVPDVESRILAIWDGRKFIERHAEPDGAVGLILNRTNFYAEAGGQLSDSGVIKCEDGQLQVESVYAVNDFIVHQGFLLTGFLNVGSDALLKVDVANRAGCTRNHTATHLLQAALRNVIGETAQKSSVVTSKYLRFDFSVKGPLTKEQYEKTETFVCDAIKRRLPVERIEVPSEMGKNLTNLITLPGASYPKSMTVIAVRSHSCRGPAFSDALSLEACCGTHVGNTENIKDFVILSQRSLSQVSRSIRAVTGPEAVQARRLGEHIASDVDRLERNVAGMEADATMLMNFDIYQELSSVRASAAEDDIPLIWREPLDHRIERLKIRVARLIRQRVKREVADVLGVEANRHGFVHFFSAGGSESVIFAETKKLMPNIPFCCFVALNDRLHCQCRVPMEVATEKFNAREWATVLMPHVRGIERRTNANPRNVCVFHADKTEKMDRVLDAARRYIADHSSLLTTAVLRFATRRECGSRVLKTFSRNWSSALSGGVRHLDPIQVELLNEPCIVVNENDERIGMDSKRNCHMFVPPNSTGILHRAFSVFLFNEQGELLLQKRSQSKITFPGNYTNTCCSHPLHIPEEMEEIGAMGVKRAAIRRLEIELGIPKEQISFQNLHYLTRIHYCSPSNDEWGEHEIDYILFYKGDVDVKPNSSEVEDVLYVKRKEIKEFIDSLSKGNIPITPWFDLVANTFLFKWWDNLDNLEQFKDHESIHRM